MYIIKVVKRSVDRRKKYWLNIVLIASATLVSFFGGGLLDSVIRYSEQYVNFNKSARTNKPPLEDQGLIKTRTNCNKSAVLNRAKTCTLRVLRDDGGHGSGFVTDKGFIITNRHVIQGAKKITVYANGFEREVSLWNYSTDYDLAILSLPGDVVVQPCNWFDSSDLNIAEEVYAFGWPDKPTGDSTVTKGIFSRRNTYLYGNEEIQTDASINPGNSGGPLVNECGIVGINTSRSEWTEGNTPRVLEGIGFALPSNSIYQVVKNLISAGNINKKFPAAPQKITNSFIPQNSASSKLDIQKVKEHLSNIYRIKNSWEQARDKVDNQKLDKLLDLFNRQIDFCLHLVDKLSVNGAASNDDIILWNSVVKMSNESGAITTELNRK